MRKAAVKVSESLGDKRIPVTTSTVVGSPEPPLPYRVKRLYPKFAPSCAILAKPIPGTDQLRLHALVFDGPGGAVHGGLGHRLQLVFVYVLRIRKKHRC